jgi:hypothetical protein
MGEIEGETQQYYSEFGGRLKAIEGLPTQFTCRTPTPSNIADATARNGQNKNKQQ